MSTSQDSIKRISERILEIAERHSSKIPVPNKIKYIVIARDHKYIEFWRKKYEIPLQKIVPLSGFNHNLMSAVGFHSRNSQLILLGDWYEVINWTGLCNWYTGWYRPTSELPNEYQGI